MKALKIIGVSFSVLMIGFILFGVFKYNINPKVTASNLCFRTGDCIKGLSMSDSGASRLYYTDDGQRLFGDGASGIKIWATEGFKGNRLAGSSTKRLVVAPDGRYAIIKKDNEIEVFDADGNDLIEFSTASKGIVFFTDIAFTTTADMLIIPMASEESEGKPLLSFWSLRTGDFVTQLPHEASISSLATKAGLIAVGLVNGDIVLWPEGDFNSYSILKASEASIKELTFDTEGQALASSDNDGLIKVWNLNNKESIAEFHNPNDFLTDIALSSSPDLLLASYANNGEGRIRAWNIISVEQLGDWLYPRSVGEMAISPDGKQLAISLWEKSRIVNPSSTTDTRYRNNSVTVIRNSQRDSYVEVDPAVILIRDISSLSN